MPNALLMSSTTLIVRASSCFWLKTVVMVLFMLCKCCVSFISVLCSVVTPCCVVQNGVRDIWKLGLHVQAIVKRSEMDLYEV